MGLDIYHCRATLNRPAGVSPYEASTILLEDYEGFDVPFSYFSDYIRVVQIPVEVETVIIPHRRELVQSTNDWFQESAYQIIFNENSATLDKEIKLLEKQRSLTGLLTHTWETDSWKGIHYFHLVGKEGFYTEDIGYQRKGMNHKFHERFYSNKTWRYTSKEDFDFALSCVDSYWPDDTIDTITATRDAFKRDFVDSYKPGASFMHTCY